jgi:DNA-binding CsgD family transcriptional regulator
MRANVAVLDFIERLNDSDTEGDVVEAFQKLIAGFGFNYFCIGTIHTDPNKRGTVLAHTAQGGWFRHWYRREIVDNDPVLRRLRVAGRAFRWSGLHPDRDAASVAVLDDAREFGIRDGWASGVATNVGRRTVWTLGTGETALRIEDEAALHLASLYCGLTLGRLIGAPPALRSPLSGRERECLSWVAAGKTDWEISSILGISQKTAHEHVRNALRKLNASTRAHAVAIAISTGQISL